MKARTRDANEKKIAREKKIVINFSEKALLSKLPIDEKKTTLKMGKIVIVVENCEQQIK